MINDLDYESIKFLKGIIARLKRKIILALMYFLRKMV